MKMKETLNNGYLPFNVVPWFSDFLDCAIRESFSKHDSAFFHWTSSKSVLVQ